jgi:para-aminobenzoate synthetase/4-amino-4-deoxychorismate lyase
MKEGGRNDAFRLIETMRWSAEDAREATSDGVPGIARWSGHAQRLRASARHFGFAFDAHAFRRAVTEATRALDPQVSHKVRATLGRAGDLRVTTTPLAPPPDDAPVRLVWADVRAVPTDSFFRHKTTRRDAYAAAYRMAQSAGADEALLLNTHGDVTEGSRTNLFADIGGRLVTPPVASGLLGGVYRAYVLAEGAPGGRPAAEAVLRPADVLRADALYVCNAVRGWQRAVLTEAARRAVAKEAGVTVKAPR